MDISFGYHAWVSLLRTTHGYREQVSPRGICGRRDIEGEGKGGRYGRAGGGASFRELRSRSFRGLRGGCAQSAERGGKHLRAQSRAGAGRWKCRRCCRGCWGATPASSSWQQLTHALDTGFYVTVGSQAGEVGEAAPARRLIPPVGTWCCSDRAAALRNFGAAQPDADCGLAA